MKLFHYLIERFFFKQNTAYEMRISDWSSDVCSSDLHVVIADAKARITRKIAPWLRCGEVQRAARSVAAEQGSLCATQDLGVGHIEQAEITNDGAAIINAIDINAHSKIGRAHV